MKKIILIIMAGLLFLSPLALCQEVYKWVDEKGTTHFTDDLSLVPEKYRARIQKVEPPKEFISPQPPLRQPLQTPKGAEPGKGSPPASEQTDIFGRGEEWWRAKASEWNEKLTVARRNHESAHGEWKSKQSELEASKFKPDSLKRKLKAEIKTLEGKVKDWEKKIEEARNMLEKVLPQEAKDYRADPEWLKIEEKK